MTLLRALTAAISPGASRGRLLTFFFHRVLPETDPMRPDEMDAKRFDEVLEWIGEQFCVLPARLACERLRDDTLPPRAATISFDDGYRDNHDVALPLLRRRRMQAAFFITTGYLGDGVQFNDRLTEAFRDLHSDAFDAHWLGLGRLPIGTMPERLRALSRVREKVKYMATRDRWEAVEQIEAECGSTGRGLQRGRVMMTPEEVGALAANGMEIGGHTVTHPILQSVDDDAAFEEISRGRRELQTIVGDAPALFAYPNGKLGRDFDLRHAEMARRAGFSFAFSTERGAATRASDPLLLPRFMPWNTDALRFKLQALKVLVGR